VEQRAELAVVIDAGPDRETDGVVRWRRIDLQCVIKARFGVDYHERYVGTLLKSLGSATSALSTSRLVSNRVFESYDAIVAAACEAWNRLIELPDRIGSIGLRD
jgi:hypothetical protein